MKIIKYQPAGVPAPVEQPVDLTPLRQRLEGQSGPRYWRSLNELADTEEFQQFLHQEFPAQASEFTDPAGRRTFLKLMGASLAFAGLSGCTKQPKELIVPYAQMPEEIVPGRPLHFATAISVGGLATGVLVESHMGRPTKIEGNPEHPASLGATDARTQAAILGLYDPDRSSTVIHLGEIRPWGDLLGALRSALEAQKSAAGAGLRILTETVTSPTLAAQIEAVLAVFPEARWHQYEPLNRDNAVAGARAAFGRDASTRYRIADANVILSLDADFLTTGPAAVRHAREFASRRRPDGDMNRLYVAEPTPSCTGSVADHRLRLPATRIETLAWHVARKLGVVSTVPAAHADQGSGGAPSLAAWVEAVAGDLQAHRGAGLVIAGEAQPPAVHALAHAINETLGNSGRTALHAAPVEASPTLQGESLAALTRDMRDSKVSLLLILGGNPVATAPADLDFAGALESVGLRLHMGEYNDETAVRCHWHVPAAHSLESWSDTRAYDGTISIVQPLIEPLFRGRTLHELLAVLTGQPGRSAHDILRESWKSRLGDDRFESQWRRALHDGLVAGTELPPRSTPLRPDWLAAVLDVQPAGPAADTGLEIVFRGDPSVHDGRFANNGWLQEMPGPLTKLTWDNAALISPATAEGLGVDSGDVVNLSLGGSSVEAPVWIFPGQAEHTVTVHLGYGRTRAGRVGNQVGFDAYRLRTQNALHQSRGLLVQATGRRQLLACTQEHQSMEGRHLVRSTSLGDYRQHPDFAQHMVHEPGPEMTMYPNEHTYEGHSWGMTIDLNACTGCNACVVACQAENNIPVVGREQVAAGREMHWIRIDRYYEGELDDPEVHHQPVMCMHCENAPCEVVCPVAATVHSSEGLNDMVYNRCVGTRYCSNNCPYKVRRFNFFQYSDWDTPSLKLGANPDVTVRSRGVMEKCTYCVQRINGARIEARKEGRSIGDGEAMTACQQACPSGAIVFGDLNDGKSRVAALKTDSRNYGILTELNTKPRTTYLASVDNPHPALAGTDDHGPAVGRDDHGES